MNQLINRIRPKKADSEPVSGGVKKTPLTFVVETGTKNNEEYNNSTLLNIILIDCTLFYNKWAFNFSDFMRSTLKSTALCGLSRIVHMNCRL